MFVGNFDDAMKTAIRCCEYDDILKAKDIYSILALSALKNGFLDVCSKSFIQVGK